MTIQQITDSLLCSGCGTCNAICGHQAISMKKTPTMGLLHAEIDASKCTDCGLCLKMCPSAHILEEKEHVTEQHIIGNIEACYVGRSLNKEHYANAQSGGMATTILNFLFEHNLIDAAISCRMEYGKPTPHIHYTIITNPTDLLKNQRSCYTQVDIVSALKETSKYKSIALVGIPCHIQGVSNLMSLKKFSNIRYRIGLICDKSHTDSYMNAIIDNINIVNDKLKNIYKQKDFTYKGVTYSYQHAPTVVTNQKGEMTIIPNSKRMFLKDFFTVPKCKLCWDKLNTKADIVLGDPWGLKGKYDEQKGDSVIIVRTAKATKMLNDMLLEEKITLTLVEVNEVAKGQLIKQREKSIHNANWDSIKSRWTKLEQRSYKSIMLQARLICLMMNVKVILSDIKGLILSTLNSNKR